MAPKLGKIASIVCKDFVTFNVFTIHPTDFLNVIYAPNGVGKSSVVAAIFIGLGGDPKLLGRSKHLNQYVRNGKTVASIIIEIYSNNEGTYTTKFSRSFNRSDNNSEFKINNVKVTKDAFLQKVRSFNIQINNLCQFLPQDRVHEFASMNPQELFINTLNSVCDSGTMQQLTDMKNLRRKQLEYKNNIDDLINAGKGIQATLDGLKEGLARYNACQVYAKELFVCNVKKMWLQLEKMQLNLKTTKEELKKASSITANKKNAYNKILQDNTKIKKDTDHYNNIIINHTKNIETCKNNIDIQNKEFQKLKNDIEDEIHKYESQEQELKELRGRLENAIKHVEAAEIDYQDAKSSFETDNVENSLYKVSRDISLHKDELNRKNQLSSELIIQIDAELKPEIQKYKDQMDRLINVREQKIDVLKSIAPGAYFAMEWKNKNAHLLEGRVYDPVLIEIKVLDSANAKYLENSIPFRDLCSFVCESKNDMTLLSNELCVKQNKKVNLVYSPPSDKLNYHPSRSIQELKRFGFQSYLIDLIEGPVVVLNSLCKLFNLHNIPMSSNMITCEPEEIPGVYQYFGENYRYNVKPSAYTNVKSVMQIHIRDKRILNTGNEKQKIDETKQKYNELIRKRDTLRNERTALEAQIKRLEHECNNLYIKRSAIEKRNASKEQARLELERRKQNAAKLKQQIAEYDKNDSRIKEKTQQCVVDMPKVMMKKLKIIANYQKALLEKKFMEHIAAANTFENRDIAEKMKETQRAFLEAENTEKNVSNCLKNEKTRCDRILDAILKLTNGLKPTDAEFGDKEIFQHLPNDIVELELKISDLKARAELVDDNDKELYDKHEKETAHLQEIKLNIEKSEQDLRDCNTEITKIYKNWFNKIDKLIKIIDNRFQEYTTTVGFMGEIALSYLEEYDFDSYGIKIMVQFRAQEALQQLDRLVQSGGERSITIALYTLALQELSNVPFRCADEINQGMDSTNERKVYELLLKLTAEKAGAQYFFITPNLLSDLPSHPNGTVHALYNSSLILANVI